MTITIHHLAEMLKLSITTVSRALDGYDDVSEETRKRVVEAAHKLGYEPSYAARQLRRKRTDSIGYILPTSSPRFSDPFYINFLSGLCDEISMQNFDLIVSSSPPGSDKEKHQYRQWVQSHRVDGMVINRTRMDDWRIDLLLENQIPFVSLGKSNSPVAHPYIDVQDTKGVKTLVMHLIKKGHQKIAFIGASPNLVVHFDRLEGFKEGLATANISYNPSLVLEGDLTEEGGYQATRGLLALEEPPTAIIGCNDLTALGVMRAAKEKGLYIGTQLAIAGYDGIQETQYTVPPLTTIYQPTYEIARKLSLLLIDRIKGKPLESEYLTIEPELIIRPSTG